MEGKIIPKKIIDWVSLLDTFGAEIPEGFTVFLSHDEGKKPEMI